MHITGEFRFDYALIREAALSVFSRRWLFWTRLLSPLLIIFSLLAGWATGFEGRNFTVLGVAVLLLAMPELLALLSWQAQRSAFGQPVHYELTDGAIRITTASSDTTLAWSGLTWVRKHRNLWLIRHGAVQSVIPRAAFDAQGQAAIDARVTG